MIQLQVAEYGKNKLILILEGGLLLVWACSECGGVLKGKQRINAPISELAVGDRAKDCRAKKCEKKTTAKVVNAKSVNKAQAKLKAAKDGSAKAGARKELTGRTRQGNHDSRTKKEISGGAKGEKHAKGVRQAGRAGKSK